MESFLLDSLFVVVVALTAWAVSRTGGVRAAFWFVGITVSAIIALNLFEPVTQGMIRMYVPTRTSMTWPYGRFNLLLLIFASGLMVLFGCLRWMLPTDPEMSPKTESVVRWLSGVLGGYVVGSFLLLAMTTLPVKPDFGGYFPSVPADRPGPVMRFAPDYQLLKVTQIASGDVFPIGPNGTVFPEEIPTIGEEVMDRWASFPVRYHRWRVQIEKNRIEDEQLQKELDEEAERQENAPGDNVPNSD